MIGLLGKGGMGEVYRADDLKLGLQVALKFLPENVERDSDRLDRFVSEVRMSLRVTHPNVCRVFDVGQVTVPEATGHGSQMRHFLSMEYVDGEDLASLLRRIGRLPEDKAVEIARQLCAGLSAAHDEGVLHRDLKPANIMIDGRGRAKIADFGLAGVAGISGAEARAGTPQYMAPEQVSGGTLTERTDIYALGLVLYEIFTGKRAFEIKDLDDLQRLSSSTPTSPSSHVSGLNPLVERAILRCLDPDPQKRPASASALAAALPGGDPLAMAIAAGDTPSPEMVAAAGSDAGLRPSVAWSLGLFTIAGAILAATLTSYLVAERVAAPTRPPAVLIERAREMLRGIEFPAPAEDSAWGTYTNWGYLNYASTGKPLAPGDGLAERGSGFWYRQSPQLLERRGFVFGGVMYGVRASDPQIGYSGEVLVEMDRDGRLIDFTAMPQQFVEARSDRQVDWKILFGAAGLNPGDWVPAEPVWSPKYHADRRFAWTRRDEGAPGAKRIEAASFQGTPVNFYLIFPWTVPNRIVATTDSIGQRIGELVVVLMIAGVIIGSLLLARRNVRLDRADRRGAIRLAAMGAIVGLVVWVLEEHHVMSPSELNLFTMAASAACFGALMLAGMYLAFEPYVRRTWPSMLVSWTRLISGSIRDPLVARDVLIGCAAGVAYESILSASHFAARAMGERPIWSASTRPFLSAFHAISEVGDSFMGAIFIGLTYLFVLFVIRRIIRHDWLAPIATGIAVGVPLNLAGGSPMVVAIVSIVLTCARLLLLARVGLVPFTTSLFVSFMLPSFPFTIQMNTWYATVGLGGVITISALAIASMRVAMGGSAQKVRG